MAKNKDNFEYNIEKIESLNEMVEHSNRLIQDLTNEDLKDYQDLLDICNIYTKMTDFDQIRFFDLVVKTNKIYLNWVRAAEKQERFEDCITIMRALEIENNHFVSLGKNIYDEDFTEEVAVTFKEFKRVILN